MSKKRSHVKRGVQYEKQQARKHRGRHLGGPGRPDYQRGEVKGEVKNWKRPVHSGVIREAHRRGIREIASKSGFTQPAIQLAERYGIKLISSKNKRS